MGRSLPPDIVRGCASFSKGGGEGGKDYGDGVKREERLEKERGREHRFCENLLHPRFSQFRRGRYREKKTMRPVRGPMASHGTKKRVTVKHNLTEAQVRT